MSRPLLITDCDEVLLHMVSHFRDWLHEAHDLDFAFETGKFEDALTDRRRHCGHDLVGREPTAASEHQHPRADADNPELGGLHSAPPRGLISAPSGTNRRS